MHFVLISHESSASKRKRWQRWVPRLGLVAFLCTSALAGVASTVTPAALAADPDCPTTEAALQSDLIAVPTGGTFTFNCAAATTIPFTSQLVIQQNVTLDATSSAAVTFDGGGATRLLLVGRGIILGLNGISLQNGSSNYGSAVEINGGTLTVTDSTFLDNSANGGGSSGGAIFNAGSLTVTNSTFSGNSATGANNRGGAIDNEAGDPATVTFSTFSGNSAASGSAIYNDAGSLQLTADIFSGSSSGGNCAKTASGAYTTDNGYNVDSDGTCASGGTGDISANPKLGSLASNGGPTETVALLPGSPAIDIVPKAQCPATDQRGAPRYANGESSCDSGAFEYLVQTLTCPTSSALSSAMANAPTAWAETIELTCTNSDTIDLSGSGNSGTITVTKSLVLDGSQSPGAIILDGGYSGDPNNPTGVGLFSVNGGINFVVNGLTLQNGNSVEGGAIDNNGTLTVTNSTFAGDAATGGGLGGAINNNGTLAVTNSTFSGNMAGEDASGNGGSGGAIANYSSGSVTVTNSTFSGNSAPGNGGSGGAIANGVSPLVVTNSTFSGNSASDGGAIFINGGTLTIGADIFANSPSGSSCSINGGGTVSDDGYNDNTDGSCTSGVTGDTSADPQLGSLASNGGPTQTFALSYGSPAVDAVPTSSGLCPSTDQRGAPRNAYGDSYCDTGSFEFLENNLGCPSSSALSSAVTNAPSAWVETVELSCPNATTIPFYGAGNSGPIAVNTNVLLDASHSPGAINFDGGYGSELFSVGSGGHLALNGLTLQNAAGSEGGAINNNGALTVTNSTFAGNVSMGGAINNNGTVTVSNSTFSGNSTPNDGSGGAIQSFGGAATSVRVTNSTFSGNSASGTAGLGGAIACCGTVSSGGPSSGGTLTVTNSTFSGGSASGGGAAIFTNVGTVQLGADIFANSQSGANCYFYGGTIVDDGYNVDTDGTCASGKTGDTSADPKLGPLSNNGGPTETFALLAGSPATDQVPSGYCPPTDQRGDPRPGDTSSANPNGSCDVGAFETQNPLTFTVQLTMTYGGTVPNPNGLAASNGAVTFTGDFNGDSVSDINGTTAGCSTTATASSPAGTYPITGCSGFSATRHDIFFGAGTVTIVPAPLTVTAGSPTTTYGQGGVSLAWVTPSSSLCGPGSPPNAYCKPRLVDPVVSCSYTGLVNGDSAPAIAATGLTGAQPGASTGSYPTQCWGAYDPNYSISYTPGTLTISQASLTIHANRMTANRGGLLPQVTWHADFANNDTASSLAKQPSCRARVRRDRRGHVTSPAGTYRITCAGARDPNYRIRYAPGKLVVKPRR